LKRHRRPGAEVGRHCSSLLAEDGPLAGSIALIPPVLRNAEG
jgi:hypothetical protein